MPVSLKRESFAVGAAGGGACFSGARGSGRAESGGTVALEPFGHELRAEWRDPPPVTTGATDRVIHATAPIAIKVQPAISVIVMSGQRVSCGVVVGVVATVLGGGGCNRRFPPTPAAGCDGEVRRVA